jgi:hypothetical protein
VKPLHPAVRDIAATGWVCALAGAAVLAVAAAVGRPGDVFTPAAACLIAWAVIGPFTVFRQARRIVEEAGEAPPAPVARRPSPAVWSLAPQLVVLAGAAVLLSIPAGAVGGILLGTGAWQLGQAAILRRWERKHGLRLHYRAVYRWAGTNGRALGRGWFDPANFVAS